MNRNQQLARVLFALSIAGMGVLAFVSLHFGLGWYSVPTWLPLRAVFTIATGVILLSSGVGLLFARTERVSARVLLAYLVVWLLMRVPTLIASALIPVVWENAAEIGTLVAGALVLFVQRVAHDDRSPWRFVSGASGMRIARTVLGLSFVAFGVAHFAYIPQTARLIPSWIPFSHNGWSYLTGACHVAAGIGVLFSFYPRVAALVESLMLGLFSVIVWVPATIAAPTSMPTVTEIVVSFGVTAGAWVVGESIASGRRGVSDIAES